MLSVNAFSLDWSSGHFQECANYNAGAKVGLHPGDLLGLMKGKLFKSPCSKFDPRAINLGTLGRGPLDKATSNIW